LQIGDRHDTDNPGEQLEPPEVEYGN